jgi:hypothetical protein
MKESRLTYRTCDLPQWPIIVECCSDHQHNSEAFQRSTARLTHQSMSTEAVPTYNMLALGRQHNVASNLFAMTKRPWSNRKCNPIHQNYKNIGDLVIVIVFNDLNFKFCCFLDGFGGNQKLFDGILQKLFGGILLLETFQACQNSPASNCNVTLFK